MSRTVIGYQDGRKVWSEPDDGCTPKRQGWGGSALGHFTGTVIVTQRHHPALREKDRLRGEALLGRKREGARP